MTNEMCFEDEVTKCIETGNSDFVKIAMREDKPRKHQVENGLRRLIKHRILLGVVVLCSPNNQKSMAFAKDAFWDLVRNGDHEAAQWLYVVYSGQVYEDHIWFALSKNRNIKFAQFLIDQKHTNISREYLVDVIEEGGDEFVDLILRNTTDKNPWRYGVRALLESLYRLSCDDRMDLVSEMIVTCGGDEIVNLIDNALSCEKSSGLAGEYDFLFKIVAKNYMSRITDHPGLEKSIEAKVRLDKHCLDNEVPRVGLIGAVRRL
ncbi:hypothetical protein [Xanthomonas axonopodis]